MNDQKTVVNFRDEAKDKLGHWLARIVAELAFSTMAGIDYDIALDGSARTYPAGIDPLTGLSFGGRVTAPTSERHFRWDAAAGDLVLDEYHQVFNTSGAAAGSKWGSDGNVDGCRISLCGARALAAAILNCRGGYRRATVLW